MKKKNIKNNIVEDYLIKNPRVIYSLKTLKKKLNIKKKSTVFWYAINSDKLIIVSPLKTGSCKKKLNLFMYKN